MLSTPPRPCPWLQSLDNLRRLYTVPICSVYFTTTINNCIGFKLDIVIVCTSSSLFLDVSGTLCMSLKSLTTTLNSLSVFVRSNLITIIIINDIEYKDRMIFNKTAQTTD